MDTNSIITIQELIKRKDAEFGNYKKIKLVRHDSLRIPKIQGNIIYDGTLYDMYCHDYHMQQCLDSSFLILNILVVR